MVFSATNPVTTPCPGCGSVTVQRGPLVSIEQHAGIYANGKRLRLPPAAAKVLQMLIVQEYATADELAAVVTRKSLKVHITRARAVLPPNVSIENDWGKGYRLVVQTLR